MRNQEETESRRDGIKKRRNQEKKESRDMSLIKGMHHVAMKCCNGKEYAETVHFYTDVLGLKIARTCDNGIMFDTGSGLIEIFRDGVEQLPQWTIRHFAFAVDDADACADTVKAAGYEVFVGPKDIVIPSAPAFPARIAFCRGPLGEEIEFFQEK